jgi:hypothetical protein
MELAFVGKEDGEYHNFNVDSTNNNEEALIYYDWLADNATTSHMSHQREVFTLYTPLTNVFVTGVG